MKRIRHFLLGAIGGMLMVSSSAQIQNGLWSLPPGNWNQINLTYTSLPTGPDPTLDYAGQPSQYCHNAVHDASGNLLFFVHDGVIYDKDGVFVDFIYDFAGPVYGGAEVSIVPDPGNCNKYYIFTSFSQEQVFGVNSYIHTEPYVVTYDLSNQYSKYILVV
ncbi:MAG: hypothetical protein ACK40M_01660 [Flavobacteriales bacterium]